MFGYVLIDKPNMLIKDYYLYRAIYCGICKALKRQYSTPARLLTNYDVTFFCALCFSVAEQRIDIKAENCILNPLKKKPIVQDNEILQKAADVCVLLGEYKLQDDVLDGDKKRRIARAILKRDIKKARQRMPEVAALYQQKLDELHSLEQNKCSSIDKIAVVFAEMMRETAELVLTDKYTAESGKLIYAISRWIYIADALDDLDDDKKKGNYNPFFYEFEGFESKEKFIAEHKEDVEFILNSAYNGICRAYEEIPSNDYEGVLTNIVWYGILNKNKKLLNCEVEPKPWEKASLHFGNRDR